MSSATGPVHLPENPRDPALAGPDEVPSSPDKTEAQTSSWVEEFSAQSTFFANDALVQYAPLDVLSGRLPKMHEEVAIWDDDLVTLMIRFATA